MNPQDFWRSTGFGTIWLTPALAGVALILIGLLIIKYPVLLEYFVGGMFMLAGGALLSIALRMRRRVTYRRMDGSIPGDDERGPFGG